MRLNLDWNKDFQEFQDILNSGIHPEWLYCAKDIIKASKIIPFF